MKSSLFYLPLVFTLILLTSCNESQKTTYVSQSGVTPELDKITTAVNHPGKKLMESKCYACHNPSTGHEGRIAPPMVAVKSHYMNDETTKEEFIATVWNFVQKPSKETSKMRGAVKRFGLMPYQPFPKEEIELIADYMYDYKIDEPAWFKEHIEEESKGKMQYRNDGKIEDTLASFQTENKADIGLRYALQTKQELGKNLMGTIQKKGTLEAVSFCNKKAYPITDSMAVVQNARIRRVSDKPRNPANQASQKELSIITHFKKVIASDEDYEPVTEIVDDKVNFYYPITTNSMCLQCHGTPTIDIEPAVLSSIKNLYPTDKAVGYNVNEVRGIWSISYEN
jgi:nitrate reductase cytochrome c-type subunit